MVCKYNNKIKFHESDSKILYQVEDETTLVQSFKDSVKTSKGFVNVLNRGIVNNIMSAFFMEQLSYIGIDTHFVEKINMREQAVQIADMIPIKFCISNMATEEYEKRFDIAGGTILPSPNLEYIYKSSSNTYINEGQIINFNWLSGEELKIIKNKVHTINAFISGVFASCGIKLVECRLEFGRIIMSDEYIIALADEISLESCRIFDPNSDIRLGREYGDQENILSGYEEIINKLNLLK